MCDIPAYTLLFPNLTYIPCRFKSSPVNAIFCQALAGSPLRPQRLAQLDKEREEQLKPPFSATAETREVRRAREDDRGGEKKTGAERTRRHLPQLYLWRVTGGGVTGERGGLHLHSQTHDCRRAVSGHCRHHSHLSSDRRPANQGVPQWLVLSAWGEACSSVAPEQLINYLMTCNHLNVCVFQGVGWWKYEFCYGKHVHQYHEVRVPPRQCECVCLGAGLLMWNT